METCDVAGCDRRVAARGWCTKHYGAARRHDGNPLKVLRYRGITPEERFWKYVDASGPCWLWQGYRTHDGYGRFNIRRGLARGAHRFSWTTLVGEIPDGMQIDHLCRVRHCVNPDHLEVVTSWQNTLRGRNPVGVRARANGFTE